MDERPSIEDIRLAGNGRLDAPTVGRGKTKKSEKNSLRQAGRAGTKNGEEKRSRKTSEN